MRNINNLPPKLLNSLSIFSIGKPYITRLLLTKVPNIYLLKDGRKSNCDFFLTSLYFPFDLFT